MDPRTTKATASQRARASIRRGAEEKRVCAPSRLSRNALISGLPLLRYSNILAEGGESPLLDRYPGGVADVEGSGRVCRVDRHVENSVTRGSVRRELKSNFIDSDQTRSTAHGGRG